MSKESIIALLHGPDQSGIVSRVSSWIYNRNGNINHADQHKDQEANIFFQRIEWVPEIQGNKKALDEAKDFKLFAEEKLNMNTIVKLVTNKPKIALFVSKIDHCFHDLILRFKAHEMNGDIACVISNHSELKKASENYNIPFYFVPIDPSKKSDAEILQNQIIKDHSIDLVVLARYMQILSPEFLRSINIPVINIHHSFLPAFAGGKPYHQAYTRGVKLIGATAHYATADLDEGPIIHQDVTQINHRNTINDLIQKGKDLEKSVFAHAVRLHLNNRILVYNNKTVVFD